MKTNKVLITISMLFLFLFTTSPILAMESDTPTKPATLITTSEKPFQKLLDLKERIHQWKANITLLASEKEGSKSIIASNLCVQFITNNFHLIWKHDDEAATITYCFKDSYTRIPTAKTYSSLFPDIILTQELLETSVGKELNYRVNVFIAHFLNTAFSDEKWIINSFYNAITNPAQSGLTSKHPELPQEPLGNAPHNLEQAYNYVMEIIDNLIRSCQSNIRSSLAKYSTRTICTNFNAATAKAITKGTIAWDMCEQILTELPQELFEQHAEMLITLVHNNPDTAVPDHIRSIIVSRCLPPHCFKTKVMLLCLPTLPKELQQEHIARLRLIDNKQYQLITTSPEIGNLHTYLINLACAIQDPQEKFLCLALTYALNFIPDMQRRYVFTEINPELSKEIIKRLPLEWMDEQGILNIFKALSVFDSTTQGTETSFLYDCFGTIYPHVHNLILLIVHTGRIKSGINPDYTTLDRLAIPILDWSLITNKTDAFVLKLALQVIKHFSPLAKQENHDKISNILEISKQRSDGNDSYEFNDIIQTLEEEFKDLAKMKD